MNQLQRNYGFSGYGCLVINPGNHHPSSRVIFFFTPPHPFSAQKNYHPWSPHPSFWVIIFQLTPPHPRSRQGSKFWQKNDCESEAKGGGGAFVHNPRSQSPFTIVNGVHNFSQFWIRVLCFLSNFNNFFFPSKRSQSTSKSSTMLTAERIHL